MFRPIANRTFHHVSPFLSTPQFRSGISPFGQTRHYSVVHPPVLVGADRLANEVVLSRLSQRYEDLKRIRDSHVASLSRLSENPHRNPHEWRAQIEQRIRTLDKDLEILEMDMGAVRKD